MDTQEIINLTMLRPALLIQILHQAKPYLKAIEEQAQEIGHGKLELELTVRAGEVEKMEFVNRKTWLRKKTIDATG
jgi:hypothetical protein